MTTFNTRLIRSAALFVASLTLRCLAPINADGAKNIAITGGGTIDGNGDSWRQVKKSKISPTQWKALLKSGGFTNAKGDLWYPDSTSYRGSVVSMMAQDKIVLRLMGDSTMADKDLSYENPERDRCNSA